MKEIELFSIPLIEWIGYIASALVLISLSLSSILRLRIFNLFGAAFFTFYGFVIGSLPVGIVNLIIMFLNLYYLQKIYCQNDQFEIIESDGNQEYIQQFLSYFQKDIQKYFPEFKAKSDSDQIVLMVMRNMNLAGLFIAQKNERSLVVELDYVTPQYRDYKNGAFIFDHFRRALKDKRYQTIVAKSNVHQQVKYLKKMGFVPDRLANNSHQYSLQL